MRLMTSSRDFLMTSRSFMSSCAAPRAMSVPAANSLILISSNVSPRFMDAQ